tara:strand:- start:101759 stop:102292 length:534 start_codon:yes stop_codon:yes gene_type:complete
MNIKSLTLKNKLIDESTGENYFDLTAPSFKYKAELGVKAIHYVTQDQIGRVDKIAELYYGTGENIDAICATNNIFNPFSLNEGDVLFIPNLSIESEVYRRPNTFSRPNTIQSKFINTNIQSEKDQSRVQRLIQKAKTKKSGVSTPLPPNVLQPGQSGKTFKNGKIILGSNLNTKNNA